MSAKMPSHGDCWCKTCWTFSCENEDYWFRISNFNSKLRSNPDSWVIPETPTADDDDYLACMAMVAEHLDDERVSALVHAIKKLPAIYGSDMHQLYTVMYIIDHALDLRLVEKLLDFQMWDGYYKPNQILWRAIGGRKWDKARLLVS
jgi:hypothetical protein